MVQNFFQTKSPSLKYSPKILKNAAFSQQKCRISFPFTKSKSGPKPKFWSDLQPGFNLNPTKFAIVRVQSNASPVQCSSLLCEALMYILIKFLIWLPFAFVLRLSLAQSEFRILSKRMFRVGINIYQTGNQLLTFTITLQSVFRKNWKLTLS